MFEGATLLNRRTTIKVVGVCHGHFGYRKLAEVLGLAHEEVSAQVAGVHHCVWLTHFSHTGRDAEHPWMIAQVSPGPVDAY